MNAITRAQSAAEPNTSSPDRKPAGKDCTEVSGDRLQKLEADRVFEAGVQWFLAVSRYA